MARVRNQVLSETEMVVLGVLNHGPNYAYRITASSKSRQLTDAQTHSVLQKLFERKLVDIIEPDPEDPRGHLRVTYEITELGRKLLLQEKKRLKKILDEIGPIQL